MNCIIGAVPASGYYTETIWSTGIVNPNCTGNEVSIFNCSNNQTGSCSPTHDACWHLSDFNYFSIFLYV